MPRNPASAASTSFQEKGGFAKPELERMSSSTKLMSSIRHKISNASHFMQVIRKWVHFPNLPRAESTYTNLIIESERAEISLQQDFFDALSNFMVNFLKIIDHAMALSRQSSPFCYSIPRVEINCPCKTIMRNSLGLPKIE